MVISEKAHAECVRLLDLLTNKRVQESWSWVFMSPVTDIPGYHAIIKKPMDLGTVKKNLGSKPSRCRFKSHERFAKDVRLVFQNALLYNKDDEHVKGSVYDAAQHLLRVFDTAYSKSKETVFVDENEEEGAHEEMDTSGSAHASASAAPASDAEPHPHHSHHSSSSSHRHSSSDHDGKHKKDKSSKKEKKAKKSKKKSKDKDRERSRDKKHSSSSSSSSASAPVSSASAPPPPTSTHSTSTVAALPPPPAPMSAPVAPVASTSVVSSSASTTGGKMSEEVVSACLSVLMKLIKYKEGNFSPAAPFLQPVDLTHFPDYRIKVPHRMHLYGVQKKLRSGGYADIDAFAHDIRLIFSNCLIYNSDVILSKVMRSHAVTLMKLFETQLAKIGGTWPGIPERWKCHQLLHELLAHRTDGQETAQWFKYPFKTYFDSPDHVPYGYFKTIKHPMDLGTVSANLHLGTYKHVSEFLQDAKLVFDNCIRYWASDPNGQAYCESAKTLINLIKTQATSLFGSSVMEKALSKEKSKSSSSSSSKERKSSSSSATASVSASTAATGDEDRSKKRSKHSSSFAEREVCFEIVKLLRQHKMKGYRGIEILTAGPFIHAVDVTKYPDYLQVISEPMDFAKIERKLKGDRYTDVNEFCADVHLIFTNCHKYNSDPVEGADIRAMASNLRDYFVELYNERFGTGQTKPSVKEVKVETSSSGTAVTSSATATSSKSVAAPMPSPKKPKKSPAPSPTKSSSSAEPRTSSSASAPSRSPQISSRSSSVKVPEARLSSSSVAPPPLVASSAVDVKQPAPTLSEREFEELRRLKKEKKEKKEKKKKDKKEKKEKKEKKKKKKDKEKEKEGGSADKVDTKPASSSSVSATGGSSRAAPTPSTAVSKPAAPPTPARPTHVPSKVTPSEAAASSSSRSKSKKSKKTDLNSWESSCERVLNRLQKIEQVTKLHFDKPLVEVFPQLASEYLRLIPEPMDLRTLRERLHAHGLSSATDFVRKGRLIFQNAIKFNCAEDLASAHVREMSAHLLWYFDSLCAEQKLADSPEDKTKRQEMRRERAELVDTVPMEVKAKECQKLLRVLNSQKYDKNCWPFRKPVKVLFPTISPDYFEFIKTPMDLATITEKVNAFEYRMHGEFIRDVRLTFENAISYNRADKDREGWSVYAAAVHMLGVVEELWCDVTLEVLEKVRRREIVRKERERLGEKRKGEKRPDAERKVALVSASRPSAVPEEKTHKIRLTSSQDASSDTNLILKGSVTIPAGGSSSKDEESSTKLKLQLVSRNLDRMNKSERKAEEKRRKRIRREEEMARSEKRRRTAVAATDEALREAELRSRRRLQKLEIAEAVKLREERERKMKEANEEKALAAKRKFNASVWNGKLTPVVQTSQGFWSRKRTKLEIPLPFHTTIDSC